VKERADGPALESPYH